MLLPRFPFYIYDAFLCDNFSAFFRPFSSFFQLFSAFFSFSPAFFRPSNVVFFVA